MVRGAVAFIINDGHTVCVLTLHDSHKGDVKVAAAGQTITLRAGEQALISDSDSSTYKLATPLPTLGVRKVTQFRLTNSSQVFLSQFAVPCAINSLPVLKNLCNSAKPADRGAYNKLLKTAAAVQMATAGQGPYKSQR